MTSDSNEPIHLALREALDAFLAPEVRVRVLQGALALSRLEVLPLERAGLRQFIHGPLRAALLVEVDSAFAESVLSELDGVTYLSSAPPCADPSPRAVAREPEVRSLRRNGHAHNGREPEFEPVRARRSSIPPASIRSIAVSTPRPGPPSGGNNVTRLDTAPPSGHPNSGVRGPGSSAELPSAFPHVFIATHDVERATELCTWLDPHAVVIRVRSVVSLLRELEDTRECRTVVLVDCRQAPFKPMALAAIADEMPENVEVLLWEPEPYLMRELVTLSPRASRWVLVTTQGRTQEVAVRCIALLGDSVLPRGVATGA